MGVKPILFDDDDDDDDDGMNRLPINFTADAYRVHFVSFQVQRAAAAH